MADISDALTTYLSPGKPDASLGRKLNVLYNHDSAGASDRAIPLLGGWSLKYTACPEVEPGFICSLCKARVSYYGTIKSLIR